MEFPGILSLEQLLERAEKEETIEEQTIEEQTIENQNQNLDLDLIKKESINLLLNK